MMMESYYMISGDETMYYKNGNPAKEPNADLFVQKAEEALVTATISWGIQHKEELMDKMIQYGVSAIARNKYQYIYPYCDDSDEFAFIVIQFNLIPCKEIRIVDKGITIVYPQIYEAVSGTETYGPMCVNGMNIPFTIKNTTELVRLTQTNKDDDSQHNTEDYFSGYQQFLMEHSETVIKNALNDYRELQKDMDLDDCLQAVYDAMNTLEVKLLEKKFSNKRTIQIWSDIVKNIQMAYCHGPLNLGVSVETDVDAKSNLMVDKTAAEDIKVPNEDSEEEPVKMTKEELLDDFLKKAVAATGLPPELLDFVDLKKGRSSHIVPVSIDRSKTPETWKEMSDSIKEHNKTQQQKNSHTIVVEPTPFLDLLMDVLENHQTDVDD